MKEEIGLQLKKLTKLIIVCFHLKEVLLVVMLYFTMSSVLYGENSYFNEFNACVCGC